MAASPSNLLVLDAWPVMEWYRGRNNMAADKFEELLAEAESGNYALCISRINLGEIYYTTMKDFGEPTAISLIERLTATLVEVVSVTDADIDMAARLKGRYKISYADAFAAVLSMNRGAPLVTGDADFLPLVSERLIGLHWLGA